MLGRGNNLDCAKCGEELARISEEIKACRKCPLAFSRTNVVPGEGSPCSRIVFIGEAPGRNEDLQGRPFVGAAGAFLTELITMAGLRREDVFITNVVKCRPPNNREPREEEISTCLPFLLRQLSAVQPMLIVTLGRHSTRTIFKLQGVSVESIMSVRGKTYRFVFPWGESGVFPTLHPAAALYNPPMKKILEEDFKNLRKQLGGDRVQKTLDSFF